jgi:hypothetical protein
MLKLDENRKELLQSSMNFSEYMDGGLSGMAVL